MKSIGIFILNYNKKDYVIRNIQSILGQTTSDFDIHIVDNGSCDNSVKEINERFGKLVEIIRIQKNIGASQGFNKCLEIGLEKKYKYIMITDNDIVMDKKAVEELYNFLEQHDDVGLVGSKNYYMDYPNIIWSYGDTLNFDKFKMELPYYRKEDNENIPDIIYCSHVPACSMLVRSEAVKSIGFFPKDTFMYYDDVEWGYRFNMAGYKVVSYGKAKVWHKSSMENAKDTTGLYYDIRNRINLFAKYLPEKKLIEFVKVILSEIFVQIYGCNYKRKFNILNTIMGAYNDATNNIRGKAADGRIFNRDEGEVKLKEILEGKNSIIINVEKNNGSIDELIDILLAIIRNINRINLQQCIDISTQLCSNEEELLINEKMDEMIMKAQKKNDPYITKLKIVNIYKKENYDLELKMCTHVKNVEDKILPMIYIDRWGNIIASEKDYMYFRNYNNNLEFFINSNKQLFLNGIMKLRELNKI